MKIIISNYDDIKNPYYGGGGALAIHQVARNLKEKNDVTILSGRYPNYFKGSIDGINYHHIGLSIGGPKLAQFIFQLLLPFYTKLLRYDLWVESFTPPVSTAFLPLFTNKPVIGLTHLLGGESKSKEYKIPFYLIENIGIKKYHYFIVLTEFVKVKVLKQNPQAIIEIIPNGLDKKLIEKKINKKNSHILFLGRIEVEQKGLDFLLESYSLVKDEVKLPLIIAGSGTQKDIAWLNEKIKSLNLSKKVKFIGRVEGEKKDKLLMDAAFVVMPSRFETYPLVALEAMSYECPLLVFDIDGFSWLSKKYSIKVKPFNTTDYSEQILKLSKDSNLRSELGKGAKEFVKSLDWTIIANKYQKFIEKVIFEEENKR